MRAKTEQGVAQLPQSKPLHVSRFEALNAQSGTVLNRMLMALFLLGMLSGIAVKMSNPQPESMAAAVSSR